MLMSPDHTMYEVGIGRQRQTSIWAGVARVGVVTREPIDLSVYPCKYARVIQ